MLPHGPEPPLYNANPLCFRPAPTAECISDKWDMDFASVSIAMHSGGFSRKFSVQKDGPRWIMLSSFIEKRRRIVVEVCDFATEAGIFNCDSSPNISPRPSRDHRAIKHFDQKIAPSGAGC